MAARVLPPVPVLPPFQAWSYLTRNEITAEAGSRVFHTNASGAASAVAARFATLACFVLCACVRCPPGENLVWLHRELARQLTCSATHFQQAALIAGILAAYYLKRCIFIPSTGCGCHVLTHSHFCFFVSFLAHIPPGANFLTHVGAGETNPASDSEEEGGQLRPQGERGLESAEREMAAWVLRAVAAEYGACSAAVAALAQRFAASPGALPHAAGGCCGRAAAL